jgi:hypothetical protein
MPRYLSLVKIDEATAPAEGPSPELMQRMGRHAELWGREEYRRVFADGEGEDSGAGDAEPAREKRS